MMHGICVGILKRGRNKTTPALATAATRQGSTNLHLAWWLEGDRRWGSCFVSFPRFIMAKAKQTQLAQEAVHWLSQSQLFRPSAEESRQLIDTARAAMPKKCRSKGIQPRDDQTSIFDEIGQ